ncbi:MAG TPA: exonuclease SbcCD subunit D [Aggregatilineales bacterium]|nr:exonuclease SbcCD subunit D [Chloroflexota bacterium]HOA24465.1 exonuclease SbcCD subunit D [Aggregatilineales bacterium]HQA67378.1 exonuclease SbcCD subunit D [Aggregatilineales bacterium]HQE17465.1 exonuclease SbcCD subunit D [Aggregatilineales bacterium]
MPEPIRLLHFADVHIGMENHGKIDPSTGISTRVMDFLLRMNEIVDYACEHDADLAVFAGDAFKNRQPNPTYVREFARRIKRLAKQCPVVLLVGNHDIPSMVQKASTVEIFQTLEVEGVIVARTDRVHYIETKRGPIQVATVPYPMRQRLLGDTDTRGMSLGEIDERLREEVGLLIRNLVEQIDPDIPAVLTGHFSVSGAKLGTERDVMLGRDVMVMKSALLDPVWDYVALGHIHYHQDLNKGSYPPIVYSGSIERIDFGEEGAPKGFCWAEVARGATTYKFVELNARPFLTIRVDVRGQDDPMPIILRECARHDVTDAVVRVIITTSPENDQKIRDREIAAALEGASHIAAIMHDVDYPVRARLGVERPEGLTEMELLERYLRAKEVTSERIEKLKQAAEHIFSGDGWEG